MPDKKYIIDALVEAIVNDLVKFVNFSQICSYRWSGVTPEHL